MRMRQAYSYQLCFDGNSCVLSFPSSMLQFGLLRQLINVIKLSFFRSDEKYSGSKCLVSWNKLKKLNENNDLGIIDLKIHIGLVL